MNNPRHNPTDQPHQRFSPPAEGDSHDYNREELRNLDSTNCSAPAGGVSESGTDALTPAQRQVAAERRQLLLRALPLFERHWSQVEVARDIGCSVSTLNRLLSLGGVGVSPVEKINKALAKPLHRLVNTKPRGPRSKWAAVAGNKLVRARLQELYLATIGASAEAMTHGRRTGSASLALLRFADDALCPAGLAKELQAGSQPKCLLDVIREITPAREAWLRGERHAQLHTSKGRRGMTVREMDGSEAELRAGDLWELDDMSCNQPFACPDGRGGWILSRQGLYCRDVASRKWLGVLLVARPRESYRAEDILRCLRQLMSTYGKPRRGLRLERGIWASRRIRGFHTDAGEWVDEEFERPAMDDEERHRIQDGVRSLGIEVFWTYSPRGKAGIEAAFNYLQSVLATMTTDFRNLGRHRGEFEKAARELRRVRQGFDPINLGFAPMNIMADRVLAAMDWVDARELSTEGMTRQSIWDRDTALDGLEALCRTDLAVFLPEVRESTIRGGRVTCQVRGVPHDFRAPEVMAELGDGYRVTVRLDPAEPSLGAAIYNRETSSANHVGLAPGQFIGWADWEAPGHQIDYTREFKGADKLHAQRDWHRSAFRASPRPGQPKVRVNTVRDGRGNHAEASEGATPTTAHATTYRRQKHDNEAPASQVPTGKRREGGRRGSGNAAAGDDDVTAVLATRRRQRQAVVERLDNEDLEELSSDTQPPAARKGRDYAVALEELEEL